MCILLKLHCAKFDAYRMFCSKVIEEKPFLGGEGGSARPTLVKDELKFGYSGEISEIKVQYMKDLCYAEFVIFCSCPLP